jgi:Flp pilus assembly protein CpaB
MKKNLLPLLAVAFVVAILATGVFYSLVVSRMTAIVSPVKGSEEAKKLDSGPPDLGIPKGMRAISVQVGDSAGVLTMLKPGHRVDVQAVYSRGAQDMHLKTILENVAVQQVTLSPELAPGKPALPVVTLLAAPAEADVLGLADAAARIRLTLRNPADKEKVARSTVAFNSLVRPASKTATAGTRPSSPTPSPAPACAPQLEPMKQ